MIHSEALASSGGVMSSSPSPGDSRSGEGSMGINYRVLMPDGKIFARFPARFCGAAVFAAGKRPKKEADST